MSSPRNFPVSLGASQELLKQVARNLPRGSQELPHELSKDLLKQLPKEVPQKPTRSSRGFL